MEQSRILEISDHVRWIGVLDHDLVTFDIVMETRYGTTYNAYFIDAEKKVLIDTVKEAFWPGYREKLLQLTNPLDISYIVCTHTEPDHSGSLKHLLELAPQAIVA
ncbi:MAG: MBL fold metallo-hydrolase, partial [Bacteroidetes bacterium]